MLTLEVKARLNRRRRIAEVLPRSQDGVQTFKVRSNSLILILSYMEGKAWDIETRHLWL